MLKEQRRGTHADLMFPSDPSQEFIIHVEYGSSKLSLAKESKIINPTPQSAVQATCYIFQLHRRVAVGCSWLKATT